jgi:phage shock protein A
VVVGPVDATRQRGRAAALSAHGGITPTLERYRQETTTMTLLTRMSRLFKADVHGLLDRLEAPDAVLRQAVREMEEEIARREARAAAARADADRAEQRRERVAKETGELAAKLELCLTSGKDELARTVVRRKLETERLLQALTARRDESTALAQRLDREIDDCKERLGDIKRRMELFLEDPAEAAAGDERERPLSMPVTDDDVEIALLRERELRATRGATKGKDAKGGAP